MANPACVLDENSCSRDFSIVSTWPVQPTYIMKNLLQRLPLLLVHRLAMKKVPPQISLTVCTWLVQTIYEMKNVAPQTFPIVSKWLVQTIYEMKNVAPQTFPIVSKWPVQLIYVMKKLLQRLPK
jgi:hypothetical protein